MVLLQNLNFIEMFNGITAMLCVLFAGAFGLFMAFQAKKQKSKILLYGGIMGFFAGMFWLAPTLDFILILITGNNLPSPELWAILTFFWAGPALISSMMVGGELLFSEKKKKLLVAIAIIIATIYDAILLLDTSRAIRNYDNPGGAYLYDVSFNILHPITIFVAIMMGMLCVFCGIGALNQGLKSAGAIKKRFIYLSIPFFLFVFICTVDAFFEIRLLTILVRGLMIFVAWFMYLSLRIKIM
ncbi:MAG: hypothetical protein ACTSVV_19025 [Promethearchaeota archaeon]